MPKKKTPIKRVTLSVRLTQQVKSLVEDVAYMEGLTASEWVRILVMEELKRRGVLKAQPLEMQLEEG
ncbi:hypothetical protein KEJ25_05715 [Candidatus Bathyarchaeota archaeon]|nr:hypothetical protein [Candidatus Brockarchaeota archaeon]MBS7618083.1 hypothetical protein [Candidatus Bathyarchaeota archaeon]